MNNIINMKNITKLVLLVIIVCMILLLATHRNNKNSNNQEIRPSKDNISSLNLISEEVFGPEIRNGDYLNITNIDFMKYFLLNLKITDNKLIYEPLYDIKSFNKELKEINKDKFLDILNNLRYNTDNIKQDPTEIAETLEGNCSSITLFIVNWLLVNYNPNIYHYYINIIEESSGDNKYDAHVYLMIKREGEQAKRVDFSDKNNLEVVEYLNKLIRE